VGSLSLRPWESLTPTACAEFFTRNRAHLAPWEPRREPSFYTAEHQAALLARCADGRAQDSLYAYAVFEDDRLTARVALTDVVRGVFRSAHVGYLTDVDHGGRGIASHAVGRLLSIAFDELGLHRVQAAVMPRNLPSVRVLEKNGFRRIGLSPKYLLINNNWEDHLLFATTVEDATRGAAG